MTSYGRRQVLVVDSRPRGAEVEYQGEVVGVTPMLLELPRGKHRELKFKHSQFGEETLPLEAKYRWEWTFSTNLLLFQFAPVGWGIDLWTGSAWDIKDPVTYQWPGAKGDADQVAIQRVAIAPTQSADEFLSDEAAKKIEQVARERYPQAEILPYAKTLSQFLRWHYDFDSRPSEIDRRWLFKDLAVDHIVESEVVSGRSTQVAIRAQLNDFIFSEGQEEKIPSDVFALNLSPEELPQYSERLWLEKLGSFVRLIPNTISVDLASVTPSMMIDENDVPGVSDAGRGPWGQVFQYLGALGFSHMQKQSERNVWQFQFQFVPTLAASWGKIHYPTYPPLDGVDFDRLHLAMGLGPQAGWKSRFGFVYFQMIPIAGYTRIAWERAGQEWERERGSISGVMEMGYSYFFADWLVSKIFVRRVSEDTELWRKSMKLASGQDSLRLDDVGYSYVGISFGYHFSLPRAWASSM